MGWPEENAEAKDIHLTVSDTSPLSMDKPPLPKKPESSRSFARILMSQTRKENAQSPSHPKGKMTRMRSSAHGGLMGLKFLDKVGGRGGEGWNAVEKKFDQFAVDGRLHKGEFGRCIGMAEKEFAEEIFVALARHRGMEPDNGITKDEMQGFLEDMTDQNFDSRLRIFFDMCDKNGDGMLTEDEVKQVIILCASANKLGNLKGNAATYASLIMEELDPDHNGYIELWQLETLLQGIPSSDGNVKKTTKRAQTLARTMLPKRYRNPISRFATKASDFLLENWKRIWFIALWLALNISLFGWKVIQYRGTPAFEVMGYCVCVAKGSGETLKLNMALILLPVCRNTLTWLRSTALSAVIPFDDNINFHKVIAVGITIGSFIHTFFHLACDFPRLVSCSEPKFMSTLGPNFNYKQPTWSYLLSSVAGLTGIVMVVIMAFCFTLATHYFRRNVIKLPSPLHHLAGFNAFWYAHHLLVLVYVHVIIHGCYEFRTGDLQSQ